MTSLSAGTCGGLRGSSHAAPGEVAITGVSGNANTSWVHVMRISLLRPSPQSISAMRITVPNCFNSGQIKINGEPLFNSSGTRLTINVQVNSELDNERKSRIAARVAMLALVKPGY